MKAKMNSFFQLVIGAILSFFGISSCEGGIGLAQCMYGMPYSDFVIKGTVTDQNNVPIKGIKVTASSQDDEHANEYLTHFEAITDQEGKLDTSVVLFRLTEKDVQIQFTDVDGPDNGGDFESKTVTLKPKQTKKGDDSWYNGEQKVEFNVKLDKK